MDAFVPRDPLEHAFARQSRLPLYRKEAHANAVIFRLSRQIKTPLRSFFDKKLMGNLNQDARPVTRFLVATTRTAVFEARQDLKTLYDNVVGRLSRDVDD